MKFHFGKSAMLLSLFLIACNGIHTNDEERLKDNVDSFATAYFNWQYKAALPFCTQESEQWLRYAASNVHQEDVDILRAQDEGASHEINEIVYNKDDSTAYARITVRNFLQMDTIGTAGHIVKEAQIRIPLVVRNKKWLVKMEAPLQNER